MHPDQTAAKIIGFSHYEPGWCYGEGQIPTLTRVWVALSLNREAERAGFKETNAFLGLDGEIRVTAYDKDVYVEVTAEVDNTYTFVAERGLRTVACGQCVSMEEVVQQLQVTTTPSART